MKLRSALLLGILAVGVSISPVIIPALYGGSDTSDASMAMDFTLADLSGTMHKLSDYKGKIIVLEWTNPNCGFVKRHYGAGDMQELQQKLTSEGVVWLGICSSSPTQPEYMAEAGMAAKYVEWKAAQTALLSDKDGTVGHAWGAKTTPHMFVIGKDFKIVYQGAIDNDPRGKKDKAELVNYVDQAVAALLAGKLPEITTTQAYGCSVKYASTETPALKP